MTKRPLNSRGGALVLVTVALGVATILSVALLSSSSLQSQVSGNAGSVADAEYLAESGINISMHYLQHPERYTGAKPNGYYPGEAEVNLGAGAPGSVTTKVTYDPPSRTYNVSATGAVTSTRGTTQRTINAVVKAIPTGNVNTKPPTDAIVLNGDLKVDDGMRLRGSPAAVRTNGKLDVVSGGRIDGDAISDEITKTGSGEINGDSKTAREDAAVADPVGEASLVAQLVASLFKPYTVAPTPSNDPDTLVPEPAHVPDLRTYRFKNPFTGITLTYNAVKLTKSSYVNKTMGPTLTNPAGIYWTDSNVAFSDDSRINGTLLARNKAKVTFANAGSTIQPSAGYPALVSDGEIELADNSVVDLRGLVYAGRVIAAARTDGDFKVKGVMMLYEDTNVFPSDNYDGTVDVEYVPSAAQIGGFSVTHADTTVRGLKIVSWTDR